jgi:hypothetical protein
VLLATERTFARPCYGMISEIEEFGLPLQTRGGVEASEPLRKPYSDLLTSPTAPGTSFAPTPGSLEWTGGALERQQGDR